MICSFTQVVATASRYIFSSVSGPFWLVAIVNLALWAPAAEYMASNSGHGYIRPPTLSTFPFTFIYRVYSRPLQDLPTFSLARSLARSTCSFATYLLSTCMAGKGKNEKKMYAVSNERIVSLLELALNRRGLSQRLDKLRSSEPHYFTYY